MNIELFGLCIFTCGVLCLHACRGSMNEELRDGEVQVLSVDFEQSKLDGPWLVTTLKKQSQIDTLDPSNIGSLSIETPNVLKSPGFKIEPLRYYRLDFRARTTAKSFWVVTFFDASGNMLLADVYSSFDPATMNQLHTFYFQSKVDAHTAEFWMRPNGEGTQVDLLSIRITLVQDPVEIIQWADSLYATIPPIASFLQPIDPEEVMPKSINTIEKGGKLRIVMLGNSIINDTGNSAMGNAGGGKV